MCDSSAFVMERITKASRFETFNYILYSVQVTKLDRDPASGTALQEISFWLNLERALLRIQDIRESPDIALTLDILKHGKRFHATVSFDTDTGTVDVTLTSLPAGSVGGKQV